MLSRVDFDFKLESTFACLRIELKNQMGGVRRMDAIAFAEPREGIPNRIDYAANRLGLRLNQVDVFRVSQRLAEQQFVDRGAAAKGQLSLQWRMVEEVADGSADNQVLLNLPKVGPRCARRPLLDICSGDHESISTCTLTSSFHSAFRSSAVASSGAPGLTDGSSAL